MIDTQSVNILTQSIASISHSCNRCPSIAKLISTPLSKAELKGVSQNDADLSDADLAKAYLTQAKLNNVNLN
ncbi:pentapeptide repeat-containing protein [Nostoc sp. FACHB-87]|nr:pentapeptide repeat-containing protein [Nostoc sp. FACHB-87]MBD2480348.1 pentapeptide repeat-containing protein [Anabaena sp. FACHB-83]